MMNPTIDPQPFLWSMSVSNKILIYVSSILTFFGCILIFTTYILYKELRTTSRHIIVCITISDFITCAANIYGLNSDPPLHGIDIPCQIQSFIGSSFVISSFLWTVSLALFLYVTVVKENKDFADRLVWPWFHLICWLLPLTINVVALIMGALGNSGDQTSSGWCWIHTKGEISQNTAIMWMLIDGKGIEIFSYIAVIILYILVKRALRRSIRHYSRSSSTSIISSQKTVEAAKSADRKFFFVPICFVMLRIWGTIRFFIYLSKGRYHHPTLFDHIILNFQAVGDNLQGFVNCVLFCFLTTKVRHRILKLFKELWRCCCCCCRRIELCEDEENHLAPRLFPPSVNDELDD